MRLCELRSRQRSSNPVASLFGCPEQGRRGNGTLAQPRLQMPAPPVLRGVMLSVKANDQSSELAVCEDEHALANMAVDEHARRPERNVDGHSFVGPRISCQWSTPGEMNSRHVPVGPNGLSQRWAWLFHKRLLRTAGSCARNGTRCGKVGGWRVMAPVFPELTRRSPSGFSYRKLPLWLCASLSVEWPKPVP